jgi:hypothetical protein
MRIAGFVLLVLGALAVLSVAHAAPTPFETYGQPALEAINQSYLAGDISEAQALLYRFYFVKKYDKLPAQYQLRAAQRGRCGTPILLEVYARMNELPAAMLNEIRDDRARPGGLPLTRITDHYIIHYTSSGGSAASEAYIDMIAVEAEVGWRAFHVDRTWDVPPSDGAIGGGSGMIDLYVWALDPSLLGYAEPETDVPGGPCCDATGFFNVQNDMTQHDADATVVHEYMHVIQFGYYADMTFGWFMENCATMSEEFAYDDNNDYRQRFANFFAGQYQSYYSGVFDYVILWPMYICERFGDATLELIWDNVQWDSQGNIFNAFDAVLGPLGYDNLTAYMEFIRWAYYTAARFDGQHYSEADHWVNLFYPDATISSYPSAATHPSSVKRPDPLGTSIMRFNKESGDPNDVLVVTFDGPNCTAGLSFMVKTGTVYSEYLFTPDASGNGTFQVPGLSTCDYIFMMTSMRRNCGADQDYVFTADTQAGASFVGGGPNGGAVVRIYPSQPNPAVEYTNVRYELPRQGAVQVRVIDAGGRVVRHLFAGPQYAGSYEMRWDRNDDNGGQVASGVYFAQISFEGTTQTRQVTVLR